MDGTITFSEGIVYYTTEKTDSDGFVFLCLGQYFGSVPKGVKIVREPGKKPYLHPRAAEFSLSHTDGFLCAAFSDKPVGIDAENPRRGRSAVPNAGAENLPCGIGCCGAVSERREVSPPRNGTNGKTGESVRRASESRPDGFGFDGSSPELAVGRNAETSLHPASGRSCEIAPERSFDPAPEGFRAVAKRFFGVEIKSNIDFFRLWTKKEAIAKREGVPLLECRADGEVEYFTVGDFLIAVSI